MALLSRSLALRTELEEEEGIAYCLEGLAGVAGARGQAEHGAQLLGAAESLRERSGYPLPPAERERYQGYVTRARMQMDESLFVEAWARGRSLTREGAIRYALEGTGVD